MKARVRGDRRSLQHLLLCRMLCAVTVAGVGASSALAIGAGPALAGGLRQKEATQAEALTSEIDRGPVALRLRFEPARPRLSDEVQLTVDVLASEGIEIDEVALGTEIPGFFVRDYRVENPVQEGERILRRSIYMLEPMESGSFEIDPLVLVFRDLRAEGDGEEHRLESDPLTVEVQSVVSDELVSLDAIRPLAPPVELPVAESSSWGWIAAGGGAGLAILALLLWRRRRGAGLAPEDCISPRERALISLDALLAADYPQTGEFKRYYIELTQIVRRYIEEALRVRAGEQTTEEFLRAIQGHPVFQAGWREDLQRFLEAADLVKFGAQEPNQETVRNSYDTARRFVEHELNAGVAPSAPPPDEPQTPPNESSEIGRVA